ncbi:MAG: GNAT family N-acetyltransferase [Aeromicrobium sp.]|nr:GNAT family N-acetyltransferase [Burkholderiales bacterium]
MAVEIRPLQDVSADVESVRQIAYATWPDTFREILTTAQIDYMLAWLYATERLHNQVRTGEHVIHLAEVDAMPVGFVAHQLNYPTAGTAKIHKLYLLPTQQGKGIGRMLIDTVREAASQADQHAVVLNVNKYNRATNFYRANGFAQAGEEVIDIGGGYVMDDLIMRCAL